MKRLLSILLVAIAMISCSESNHLEFKGIPIDGSLKSFCKKLKGFKTISIEGNTAALQGTLAGKDIDLYVYSTPISNNVYAVSAVFTFEKEDGIVDMLISDRETLWQSLESNYCELKSMLTAKYGMPEICDETLPVPYSANQELLALMTNNLLYRSVFEEDKGSITLQMVHQQESLFSHSYGLVVWYEDKINSSLKDKEEMDDL